MAAGERPYHEAETRLFDASREVFNSARRLEEVAGAPRSSAATDIALGSLCAAFESLANSTLTIRETAALEFGDAVGSSDERDQLEQLGGLLFGIAQNLGFAAQGCRLSRDALVQLPEPR